MTIAFIAATNSGCILIGKIPVSNGINKLQQAQTSFMSAIILLIGK